MKISNSGHLAAAIAAVLLGVAFYAAAQAQTPSGATGCGARRADLNGA